MGFTRQKEIDLTQELVSEDFTSVWAGRQYTLNLPFKIGPDYLEDQLFLLLAPSIVRIYLHDPTFFIFNQNPAGPPAKRMQFGSGSENGRSLF